MAQKRYKFSVSTSPFCFLCFDTISMSNGNASTLQNIFQYLNISLEKIKSLSTKPVKLLNRTDVRVSLCSECEKTVQEISKLYKIIELAQLHLDCNFETIQKRLRSSNRSKKEEYQAKLKKSSQELFIRHSNLVTELRNEILGKCDVKMPNSYPKVSLERIAESLIKESRKNQTGNEDKGLSGEENPSVSSAFTSEQSQRSIEENASVPIPGVPSMKQEVDVEHVDAIDEPEADWNVDDLEDQKMNPTGQCKEESYQNRKIKKKGRQVQEQKYFSAKFRTCHICKEVFSTRQNLLDHLRMHCKETSSTFKSLHQRQQLTERKWPCEVCKKSLSTKQKLKENLKIHSNERPFHCEYCPKRFTTQNELTRHFAVHADSMEEIPATLLKYQCNICQKICGTKQHLNDHVNVHKRGKVFNCKLCGLAFAFKTRLKLHLKSHSKRCLNV